MPTIRYSEFLNIFNRVWEEFSKEDKADLMVGCIKRFFSKSLVKPCIFLSGFDCKIYSDRPLSCKMYGLWPTEAWEKRVAKFEKTLGLPKEQLPLNTQCPMVRRKKQTCPTCNGQGWYPDGPTDKPEQKQCDSCQGPGKVNPPALTEEQIQSMYDAIDALDRKTGDFSQEKMERAYNVRTFQDWILWHFFGEDTLIKFTNILLTQDDANIQATIAILEEKIKELV